MCDESRDEVEVVRNRTDNFIVDFKIRAESEKADLVAATGGDSENCVGIYVTDKTLEARVGSSGRETCAVLGSSSTTPTSNPCSVKIDKDAVECMQAADLEKKCRGLDQPEECPKDDLAHPRLTAAEVASLAAVLGAVFIPRLIRPTP